MSAPARSERRDVPREALLDQLSLLCDEAEALAPLLARVPEPLLTERVLDERSILEAFAHLEALDRTVYPDRLARAVAGESPRLPDPEATDGTPHETAADALVALRDARSALLDAFAALPPEAWSAEALFTDHETGDALPGTVADFALAIAQHDAAVLRMIAYRLHEAHLTDRAEDLPK